MLNFIVSKHLVMIGCDRLYVHIQQGISQIHTRRIHGVGTLETERSNVSHIVDMINIEMFTVDDYPISRDDRTWVS